MYLGRVVGRVWATAKNSSLISHRLLVVQPLAADLRDSGRRVVCLDCTGAGAGETIYYVRGREASFPFLPDEVPADMTVVGIVDSVDVGGVKKAARGGAARAAAPTHKKGRRC